MANDRPHAISVVVHTPAPLASQASRPSTSRCNAMPPSPDILTDYHRLDCDSDNESLGDDRARRASRHASSETLPGGNSFRKATADSTTSGTMSDSSLLPIATTSVRPLTLYGKDILRVFPFGTSSQDEQLVAWSDSFDARNNQEEDSIRDPHFDLTTGKITKLFTLSRPDEHERLSLEGFRSGLEAMGIACDSDDQFQAFVDVIDENQNGVISYDEFLCAIQEIKLAQLFHEPFLQTMPGLDPSLLVPVKVGAIEYSPDRIRSVYPIKHMKSFLYSKSPAWASVRWINVEGINPLLLRRLSVRYRLHPLAIEDTLGPDVWRPKYVQFDNHSFLNLQTLQPRNRYLVATYQDMYRASHFVKPGDKSPFESMSGTELETRLEDLDLGCVMAPPHQLSLFVMEGVLISVQRENALWSPLTKRLHVSYSKVRQHSTAFLMYTLMDVSVKELAPISQTFAAKLVMLQRLMALNARYFDVRRIGTTSKQIKGLEMYCKPMREVIAKVIASNEYHGETLQYFVDVQEHLATIEDECGSHLDRCQSLVEEYNHLRAAQQNDVSYILALIAAIFLPAQFLTGVYGMNFSYIPEQTYHYGYFIWWAVVLSVAGLIVLYFKYKRWL